MDSKDEKLDLVNFKDEVIGTIQRSETPSLYNTKKGFVRSSHAFLQNSYGQLWIPRRTSDKTIAPNGLDFSAAEHVGSGETYLKAIIRGFKEELNITLKSTQLEKLGKIGPQPNAPYFFMTYLYRSDIIPRYNKSDFTEFTWLNPKKLVRILEGGETAKSALLPTVKKYFISN